MADKFLRDVIDVIADDPDVTLKKGEIELVLRKSLEVQGNFLANGDKLYLIGFMNFEPKDYNSKKSKHPQTGEDMVIPAYRGVKAKPSDPLKHKLEEGYKRDHK